MLSQKKLGEKKYKGDEAFAMKWFSEVESFFKKIKGMIDYIVFACNGVDCLLETDKWMHLKEEMNKKVLALKENILTDNFSYHLKDIKMKLSSIMSFFDDVVNWGRDGFEVCW